MTISSMTAGPSKSAASWLSLLEDAGAQQAAEVVKDALTSAAGRGDPMAARLAFAQLSPKLRPAPLRATAATHELLGLEAPGYFLEDVTSRIAFLVGISELLSPPDFADVLTTLYRTGSEREQIAILRALPFLPHQDGLVSLAREASRTNDAGVFSALACDSAFPARQLPDAAFDQLVLKALFIGVSLERIQGLPTRVTPELERMVADFADERRAAGRPVPDDVLWLLELHPNRSDRTVR